MNKLILGTLAAALLAPLAAPALRADIIGFATTGGTLYGAGIYTVGYTFTLAASVQVTRLGFWDYQANGLATAASVTIWNSAGTAQASVTVPAGTTAGEINQYLYVTLATPVALPAGTYTIGDYDTNLGDPIQSAVTTITPAAGVTYGAARSISGNSYPTADPLGIGGNSYFGPNFQFTVPEPGTWAAVLAGAGLLATMTLRRRRAARA